MNTQVQQEIMNPINQISIVTTDKTNREYQIMSFTQVGTKSAKILQFCRK